MSDRNSRRLERIDNSFGTELFCTIEGELRTFRCDVADFNALGFRLSCRSHHEFDALMREEIRTAKIHYGKYLLGFVTFPQIVRSQAETLGFVLVPTNKSKMEITTRPRRADIRYLLEPTLVGPDPVRPREKLIMRIDNISEKGFRAKCSLSNKHLLPKQKFREFTMTIPGMGMFPCSFEITNTRIDKEYLTLGCQFLHPTPQLQKVLSDFLLLCTCIEKDERRDFEGERLPRKLSPLLRVRKVDQSLEMDPILDLRLKAYKEANKVAEDATAASMRDEYDANSIILGAFIGSRVVGTLRIAFSRKGSPLPFEKFFSFPDYDRFERENSVEVSRMAIDPAAQGTDIFFRLMQGLALEFMPKKEFAFLMATDELAANYKAIGARRLKGPVPHPVAKGQFLSLYVVETQKVKKGRMSALAWLFFGRELVDFLSTFGFTQRTRTPVVKMLVAPLEIAVRKARRIRRRFQRKNPAA